MVFKKIIFQNRYVELETPAPLFMEKNILNFHFDYLNISLIMKGMYCIGCWSLFMTYDRSSSMLINMCLLLCLIGSH